MTTNRIALAALMDDEIVTVKASFDRPEQFSTPKRYSFLCKRELTKTLALSDLVLASTTRGIQMVTVVEIDDEPDVDIHANYEYSWIFQKVDEEYLSALKENLKLMEDKIKSAQRKNARESAFKALGLDNLLEDKSE